MKQILWLFYIGSQPSLYAEAGSVDDAAEAAQVHGSVDAANQLVTCSQWPHIAVAIYSYQSDDPEELNFVKDEKLLIGTFENAWWRAKNAAGDEGIAPGNYLHLQ